MQITRQWYIACRHPLHEQRYHYAIQSMVGDETEVADYSSELELWQPLVLDGKLPKKAIQFALKRQGWKWVHSEWKGKQWRGWCCTNCQRQ